MRASIFVCLIGVVCLTSVTLVEAFGGYRPALRGAYVYRPKQQGHGRQWETPSMKEQKMLKQMLMAKLLKGRQRTTAKPVMRQFPDYGEVDPPLEELPPIPTAPVFLPPIMEPPIDLPIPVGVAPPTGPSSVPPGFSPTMSLISPTDRPQPGQPGQPGLSPEDSPEDPPDDLDFGLPVQPTAPPLPVPVDTAIDPPDEDLFGEQPTNPPISPPAEIDADDDDDTTFNPWNSSFDERFQDGTYVYGYSLPNGVRRYERSFYSERFKGLVVEGFHTEPRNYNNQVSHELRCYRADQRGFRTLGVQLLRRPPIVRRGREPNVTCFRNSDYSRSSQLLNRF